MSKLIKNKAIDRASSRLSSKQSTFRLPTIAPRSLDNFSLSIKRHSTDEYENNHEARDK